MQISAKSKLEAFPIYRKTNQLDEWRIMHGLHDEGFTKVSETTGKDGAHHLAFVNLRFLFLT